MDNQFDNAQLVAPFSEEDVALLNRYQDATFFHPFTCGGKDCIRSDRDDDGVLIATTEGWVCSCGKYKQYWAYLFMSDAEVIESAERFRLNHLK